MSSTGNIAASAIEAGSRALDITAENISNSLVDASRRERAMIVTQPYQDILGAIEGPSGNRQNVGLPPLQVGTGVRFAGTMRDCQIGASEHTKNKFDVYINGPGYVEVDMGNDTRGYVRALHLKTDSSGMLRLITDYPLTDNILVDDTKYARIEIQRDGKVVGFDTQNQANELGQLTLHHFVNEGGLAKKGDSLYVETSESGPPIQVGSTETNTSFMQGYIETSNIDPTAELVRVTKIKQYTTAATSVLRAASDIEENHVRNLGHVA